MYTLIYLCGPVAMRSAVEVRAVDRAGVAPGVNPARRVVHAGRWPPAAVDLAGPPSAGS